MSGIRMHDTTLVGRLRGDPIDTGDGRVYFKVDAGANLPIPCFCNNKTAKNMMKYLSDNDEVAIEGKLHLVRFKGVKQPSLLIFARHISYGRKNESRVVGDTDR
jgi:hypothetical protein